MAITLDGTTGITDADGGTVLNTNDLASQAQAEAGSDNTTLMTPLRTAQAITAQSTGGMTLLGTLTTTSGASQTLSGLTLTGYVNLFFDFNAVSHNSAGAYISIGSTQVTDSEAQTRTYYGQAVLSLSSGFVGGWIDVTASMPRSGGYWRGMTGYTNASTSIVVSVSSGAFDAGSILVYGVN